ncbi:hypothetical protein Btru_049582 [Bulinus truncatus]|nr:hypothetical protein Btru_049582 [Bulinus truncatus]
MISLATNQKLHEALLSLSTKEKNERYIFPLSSPHLTTSSTNHHHDDHASVSELSQFLQNEHLKDSKKVVIVGPDRADKTSLVFQAAVSAAALGSRVTYICTHPLKRLPCPVHGMVTPEPGIMNNVDLLYFEDTKELLTWLASIHCQTKLPSFIVIEDILNYATQLNNMNLERSLAKLCALITDAAAWLTLNNEAKNCHILLTAPTRIYSLKSVLTQFNFKTFGYQGPEKDNPHSEIKFESDYFTVSLNFSRLKNCIVLSKVCASKTNSEPS